MKNKFLLPLLSRVSQSFQVQRASLVAETVKCPPAVQETWVWSLGQEDLLEKEMATAPVFLPGESHGQKRPASPSPWGHKESETTERLRLHFTLGAEGKLFVWCKAEYMRYHEEKENLELGTEKCLGETPAGCCEAQKIVDVCVCFVTQSCLTLRSYRL